MQRVDLEQFLYNLHNNTQMEQHNNIMLFHLHTLSAIIIIATSTYINTCIEKTHVRNNMLL